MSRTILFVCREINAAHAVLGRDPLLAGPLEALEGMGCTRIAESRLVDHIQHLCNLQSTGNSAGPKIDVVARVLGEFLVDRDVRELQSAAGLYYPVEFGE